MPRTPHPLSSSALVPLPAPNTVCGHECTVTRLPLAGLLALAVVATALVSYGAVRAARGCGVIPLDPPVSAPLQSIGAAPVSAADRERRAREVMADRFGLPIE